MPRIESEIAKLARIRIEQEYAKNPNYTFSLDTFLDIAPTLEDRKRLSSSLYHHTRQDGHHTNSLKIVGKVKGSITNKPISLFAVKFVPLARLSKYIKKDGKIRKEYTPRKPKIDNDYRLSHKPTPAPVLELQNIMFGLRG